MKWYIPTVNQNKHWLADFAHNSNHQFECVSASYDHDRSRLESQGKEWKDFLSHGLDTFNASQRDKERSGVLTAFPQLPAIVGLRNSIALKKVPIVASAFNIGHLHYGLKQKISKRAFQSIDKFMVFSRNEIPQYSEWLDIDPSRFEFIPFHRHVVDSTIEEDKESPFIVSLGTSGRDYKLYFEVLEQLKYPAIVVAGQHAVEGLKVPDNVKVTRGLTMQQCYDLLQRSKFIVTPLLNEETAAGQVTITDSMMYSKAQVVTKIASVTDYLDHESDSLLTPRGDFDSLKTAVQRLWEDDELRNKLAKNGRQRVLNEFSDDAVIPKIFNILDDVEKQHYA